MSMMMLPLCLATLLLGPAFCTALPNHPPPDAALLDTRDVVKRAPADCGTFTMFCDKAAGACNNACFHIYCIDDNEESRKMV